MISPVVPAPAYTQPALAQPQLRQDAQTLVDKTVGIWGTDVPRSVSLVHQWQARGVASWQAFSLAVQQASLAKTGTAQAPWQLLRQELNPGGLKSWFTRPLLSLYVPPVGEPKPLAATGPWQWRRAGLWRLVNDFAVIGQEQPLVVGGLSLGILAVGKRFPVIGALLGVGVMALSLGTVLKAEWDARQQPVFAPERAEALMTSGKYLGVFALTLLGSDGMLKGLRQAKDTYQAENSLLATLSQPPKEKMGPLATLRFMGHSLDELLLPINWLHDRNKHSQI